MAYSDEAGQGHDLKLEAVLKRLEDAGLSIGLDKYILANRKIEYLGYEVSEDRVQPLSKKVEAIMKFFIPTK